MKRSQKNHNLKKKNTKGLYLILGLIGFFLLIKVIFLFKDSVWNENYRLNILVRQADNLSLMTLEPKEPLLTVLKIPQNLTFTVPYGYGDYQAKALGKLEVMEKKPNLVLKTVQENLAVYLDGQMVIEQGDLTNKKETEKRILGLFFGKGKTNLSLLDVFRFWWKIKSLKENEYKFLDLGNMALAAKQKLPDKSEILLLDQATFDMKMQKIFIDPQVRLENLTVEILNATDHPGLAERAARILSNTSLIVVSTGNSDQKVDQSLIESAKKLKKTRTVSLIKNIFKSSWKEAKEERRADVTFIVGEDYYQFLNQK